MLELKYASFMFVILVLFCRFSLLPFFGLHQPILQSYIVLVTVHSNIQLCLLFFVAVWVLSPSSSAVVSLL